MRAAEKSIYRLSYTKHKKKKILKETTTRTKYTTEKCAVKDNRINSDKDTKRIPKYWKINIKDEN